jgi:hypothetical protein
MMTVTNGRVVTSIEFSRILDVRASGNEILAALNKSAALMLRFEVRGRATVAGVDYLRKGGPSDIHNRIAVEALEIGVMAAETAERDPEGWVVVGALLRPWCRVGNGLSAYRRGGVPFVFKDECEGERFAERINARSKDDPTEQVKSMSARKFAREARENAEIWRQAYR